MLSLGATTFWEDFDLRWLENAARIDELTPEEKWMSTRPMVNTVTPDTDIAYAMDGRAGLRRG
ncbi:MAG: hypothetical protein ACLR23_16090 [Clostridia bacterium]